MSRYVTMDGKTTTATNPKRFVWYSLRCHYWTDDTEKLKRAGPGIPVCPDCGSPGFQTTAGEWEVSVVTAPPESCDGSRKMTSFLGG